MEMRPVVNTGPSITLVSSPPGAAIQIGTESGFLGADGTYTTVGLYLPGTYQVILGSGITAVTTSITTT